MSKDKAMGFASKGMTSLWIVEKPKKRPSMHVAFRASYRDMVHKFHAAGLKNGGRDNGEPGLRPDYSPNYYAAYLYDPDGHNIEAVCFGKR